MNKNITALIKQGESLSLEFKETFGKETVETVSAFANGEGGTILIGVSGKGRIKGLTIGTTTLRNWANQISQSTEPRLIPELARLKIAGKEIAIIRIKEYPIKPVSTKGRCYKRAGNANHPMTPQEISQMHFHSIGTSWDAFPAEEKAVKDIDLKKIERYIREANTAGRRKIKEAPMEQRIKDFLAKVCKELSRSFGINRSRQ